MSLNDASTARQAIRARFAQALALAQAVEPRFVAVYPDANEQEWQPSTEDYALRCYVRPVGADRAGLGNSADRVFRRAHVDIFLPTGIGDELAPQIFEAIAPAFLSSFVDDALEFSDAPDPPEGVSRNGYWFAPALFPYRYTRPRP